MTRKLTLTLLALIMLFFTNLNSEAKAAQSTSEIKDIIVQTAVKMGVDPCVVLGIAKQESGFSNQKRSPSGAVGVFQLMPSTAKRIGIDPYNLHDNIKGGIMYYQMMYKKFGSTDLALAAYNAGPGNVAKYKGVPPFRETHRFINTVKTSSQTYKTDPSVVKHTKPAIEEEAAPENETVIEEDTL